MPRVGRSAEPPKENTPPEGFETLFNGKDLTGWKENGKPPEHWSVRDGELVYDGKGKDLHSERQFGDFVLQLDWKVAKGGNSGVYLRGSTQVEINDGDSPTKPIWNGATGGIYPDLPPTKRAAKPTGEWNHYEIRVEKGVITVVLNGEVTVDAYAKKWGNKSSGTIGFQNHGTPFRVKNIYIKSLDAAPQPQQVVPAGPKPVAPQPKPPTPANAREGDLPPTEQQKWFTLPKDYAVELVAAEPLVVNPVSMALDEQGRIYFGESHTYRFGKEKSPVPKPTNPIVMLQPLPDGNGYERVVVAEGFDDPVMGLLIRGGKMWATANSELFVWDVDAAGKATNRRTLLTKGKGWNPFGFFILKFGPDGLLYLSMGSHDKVEGPHGQKLSPRGGGGIVCRMNPDGTNIEVLVQGFRVPYGFDIDPFGQHWQLSNGEGNPNRFAKIIDAPAADYHCFTRGVDNDWQAGLNPLAPPAFAIQTGAYTSLLAYHGAAFPESMRGKLFAVNWGGHGRSTNNHAIDVYEPDARRNVHKPADHWLTSADPHFRPTTVLTAPDGTLLLSDFYNRDDESDLTGRIWRIKYIGPAVPARTAPSTPLDDLANSDHLVRERAVAALVARGNAAVPALAEHAAKSPSPLGAATALWTLARIQTPESFTGLARGAEHADWQVRRRAAILVKRYRSPAAAMLVEALANDPDPAVSVAAAVAHDEPAKVRAALLVALAGPSATEAFTRYEACWHLARVADTAAIRSLLGSENEDTRLAGMIVVDLALFEKTAAAGAARAALAAALADPGPLDAGLLLDLASLNRSPDLVPPLKALAKRPGLPLPFVTRAVLLLQALTAETQQDLGDVAKVALAAVRDGKLLPKTDADRLAVLRLLPLEGPTPWAIEQIAQHLNKSGEVGRTANEVARGFNNPTPPALLAALWKPLADPKTGTDQRTELLATVALLEKEPDAGSWTKLLAMPALPAGVSPAAHATFQREVVRTWRRFAGHPGLTSALVAAAPDLLARDPSVKGDLAVVFDQLKAPADRVSAIDLPPLLNEPELRKLAAKSPGGSAALGRHVFARAACIKCHSTGTDSRLGPPLAGVGGQPREYLIESLFEPSRVIKTGFETELVQTAAGKVYSGMVKEEGDSLRITTAAGEDVVPKSSVETRKVQKHSIMPEGLAKTLSPAELNDLLAYLRSLKPVAVAVVPPNPGTR